MVRIKKSIIINSLASILVIILFFLFLRIFFSLSFPEKELKDLMGNYAKENFSKAVKFDDIYMTVFGNLVIKNLYVSATSDFNDNISLIKCESAKADLSFFRLFRKELFLNSLVFDNADITVYKKFGKDYLESFRDMFFSGKPLREIRNLNLDNFRVEIRDGNLFYVEVFRENKLTVECHDVSALLLLAGGRVVYDAKGTIKPYRSREISRGKFHFRGEIFLNEYMRYFSSLNTAVLENFDLSYLNSHIAENELAPVSLRGGLSADLRANTLRDECSLSGKIDVNNLGVVASAGDDGGYDIVSNENISMEVVLDLLNHFDRLLLKKLDVSDDNFGLFLSGLYERNGLEEYWDINFHSSRVNLKELSNNFTPMRDISYRGTLGGAGRVHYDVKNKRMKHLSFRADLKDFALRRSHKGRKEDLLDDCNADVKLSDNALSFIISARNGPSDVSLKGYGTILQWVPLKSDTKLAVTSGALDSGILFPALGRILDGMYAEAYEGKNSGFDEQVFLQKPLGIFINNNNIDVQCRVGTFLFGERKGELKDFSADAALDRGNISLRNFSLSGYDGAYTCEFNAFCNADYPTWKFKGSVKNLNMDRFTRDAGMRGECSGSMSMELDFEVNAYRLAQLVENGKAGMTVTFDDARVSGTVMQGRVNRYLKQNELAAIDLNNLAVRRASFTLNQIGEKFYVRNLSLNGDRVTLESYGSYDYFDGLSIPLNASFRLEEENNPPGKTINVPFQITGRLMDPSLRIKNRKEAVALRLFNVN